MRPAMTTAPLSAAANDADAYCTGLAQTHYENFPVGSWLIRKELRPHIHAVYAFARTADDFADEAEHEGFRLERLAQWRRLLYEAEAGRPEGPIFKALAVSIRECKLPILWLDHLIQAFERDVRQSRHSSYDAIVDYSKFSANPVGRLVLWIHGYRDEALFQLSDRICSALQFANFWQDVAVDLKKNRIYLPQEEMKRFGVTEADLFAGRVDERFRALMKSVTDWTWKIFEEGRPLCDQVRNDLKAELRVTYSGGTRILERIEQAKFDVFQHRPTLTWWDKGLLAFRALHWRPSEIRIKGNA